MTFDPDAIEQRQRERRAELPLLPSAIDPVAITWARVWQAEAADLTTALVAYRELEAELQEGVPQYRIALEVEQERNAELEAEVERQTGQLRDELRDQVTACRDHREAAQERAEQATAQAARLAEALKACDKATEGYSMDEVVKVIDRIRLVSRQALADHHRTQQEQP